MNCSDICSLASNEPIHSLGHYLPLIFVIGFVYVIFTRNVSGAVLSLLPFWIIAWGYPIRQYGGSCDKEHIVYEYVFHLWSSYVLGILVGMVTTLSFNLPLLYDDRIIDPSRKLRNLDDDDDEDVKQNERETRSFDLQHLIFLTSAVGVYFGVKLIRGDYVENVKCYGFLSQSQSNLWGGLFIAFSVTLAIGTFFWCLFRIKNNGNLYSKRSNLKYGTALFIFLLTSIIVFEVVKSNGTSWFGLFYILALVLFFLFLWLWIGYVGMGLMRISENNDNAVAVESNKSVHSFKKQMFKSMPAGVADTKRRMVYTQNLACKPNKVTYEKHSCKELYDNDCNDNRQGGRVEEEGGAKYKEVWWYKTYLSPFYNHKGKLDDDEFKDIECISDRIENKETATFLCSLTCGMASVTFLFAWIVNVTTDSDSDSVLFTLFAFSLFFLILLPLTSICIRTK